MKKVLFLSFIVSALMIYVGCNKNDLTDNEKYSTEPRLPQPAYDYVHSGNDQLATLGRVLFYDKKLSLNNSVACGSCHIQSKAFCDNKQFSTGLADGQTRRNTPNIVFHSNDLFWDGRAVSFQELARMPLENHVEMNNYDISKLEDKLSMISYYPALFNNAFGSNEITIEKIQQAMGEFMTNFIFQHNRFAAATAVSPGPSGIWTHGLTASEIRGQQLFFGKAKCVNCHSGASFNGWSHNYECIGLDVDYADNGLGERIQLPHYNALFRVPALLNVEFTAPYMHDGRFKTLEEVVEHYNSGVKPHPNLSWALKNFGNIEDSLSTAEVFALFDVNFDGEITEDEAPAAQPIRLNLTEQEKEDLVAFLKTLSDPATFSDQKLSDPFVIR